MHQLPGNALLTAPMVDLSHEPFRQLVRSYGGCDLFYSEMLNSRIVPTESPDTSLYLRWSRLDDLVFQILGNDPDKMEATASKLEGYGPRGIDINMGCPLNKVTVHGWGAALMKDLANAAQVLAAVRGAVKGVPLSVKIRIGHSLDKGYLLDFGSMLQEGGADFLVLHARTVPDGMSRKARWEYIALLKEHLRIPVVGNGDVKSPQDALLLLKETGCDGVMIGRQAVVEPWIFRDIKALLAGLPVEKKPSLEEAILRLTDLLDGFFPPDVSIKRFKAALFWLSQNLMFGHHLAREVGRSQDMGQARKVVMEMFARGIS
jgi:tRNA-dihydrouridine synthase B